MKIFDACLFGRWQATLTVLLASLFLSGCAATGKAPLESLNYQREEATRQPNLLVLLRGLGADNREFEKQGVIEEIRHLGLPFDVTAPNAHFGYYQAKTFAQRLKEDVIEPARRQGYKQIWLAGFSMGGLGALIYLREHPEDIDGILLTSPFLGWPGIHREIHQAGGVSEWLPEAADPDDWEQMIWGWIGQQDFKTQVPIWLGYGENDILTRAGPPLLATVLPEARVFSTPGNHTIATFKTLFRRHLLTLAKQSQPLPVFLSARGSAASTF
ncbi:MAG: alpha/beta hydrolase [Rhodocyclaceae bacterium]|nr:alpha/beta hydrolase [Rhodocyclaceae bacterium]